MIIDFNGSIEDTACNNYIVLLDCLMKQGQYENSESMLIHNLCDKINDRRIGSGLLSRKDKLKMNGCVAYNQCDIDDRWFIGIYSINARKRKAKSTVDYIDYSMLTTQLTWVREYLEKRNQNAAICAHAGDFFYSDKHALKMILDSVFKDSPIVIYFCEKEIIV